MAVRPLPLGLYLGLLPFAIGTLVFMVVVFGYYVAIKDRYLAEASTAMEQIAQLIARQIDDRLLQQVHAVQTLAAQPEVVAALRADPNGLAGLSASARAARIRALDARWRAAADAKAPVVAERLDNAVARVLQRHQAIYAGEYGEVFLTDRFGALVGSTGRLTTLAHAHKPWWQAATTGEAGKVYLDDRGLDASVGGIVLGVVVPVVADGRVLGVLKANVRVPRLLRLATMRPRGGEALRISVVRSGGEVLHDQGVEPLSTRLPSRDVALMRSQAPVTDRVEGPLQTRLLVFWPVSLTLGSAGIGFGGEPDAIDHRQAGQGQYWSVHLRRYVELDDVLGLPVVAAVGLIGLGLFVIGLISAWYGFLQARPLNRIADALDAFAADARLPELPASRVREIRRLACAVRAMARRIAEQTTSIDALQREVTRRKRAEAEVRATLAELDDIHRRVLRMEKLSAMGSFVGGIAHEISNPLMGLMGYLDHARTLTDRPELVTMLEKARAQVDRIARVVRRVLAYAQPHLEPVESVGLDALIDDACALVADEARRWTVQLDTVIAQPAPVLRLHRGLVTAALVSLLLNALYAVRGRDDPRVRLRVVAEPDAIEIVVEDNGGGVSAELAERIFDPFYTTKPPGEGTGLGLSVAARNLAAIGGEVYLARQDTAGARFIIRLPTGADDGRRQHHGED